MDENGVCPPLKRSEGTGRSSSPGEFHPEALTDPYVTLSRHTALHSLGRARERTDILWKIKLILVAQLAQPSIELCHPLRSTSVTDVSTLLQDDPPFPSASIFPFSWFALIGFLLASLEDFPYSAYPPHGKLWPPLMPDAAPPVNRYRRSLSRNSHHAAVLTSSHRFRHFNGGFLSVLFLPDT